MNDENVLLSYLAKQSDYQQMAVIVQHFKNEGSSIDINRALAEFKRLDILHLAYTREGRQRYLIQEPIRKKLLALPREFENRPYDFLLDEEAKASEQKSQKEWYQTALAKDQFEHFPLVEDRAKWSFRISIASLVIAALAIILKLNCN
jgi:hypothetical protein